GGLGLADAYGPRGLARARPFLRHPADQEDLVVHGQAEQDRQRDDGEEGLDRPRLAQPERAGPPSPLEERRQHAERRRPRQQVHHRRGGGDDQAAEGQHQQQEAQPDDRREEQRQLVARQRRQVVEAGGLAGHLPLRRG